MFTSLHRSFSRRVPRLYGLVSLFVALTLILAGHGAERANAAPARIPDHDSKESFKQLCDMLGGVWDDGRTSTSCAASDGSITVCDGEGKNCTFFPPLPPPAANAAQTDDARPDGGVGGVFVDDTPAVGAGTPTEPIDPQPSAQIMVTKYTCPQTIGYGLGQIDAYWAACTDFTPDVSFKLDGASTGNPGEQLTDAIGQVSWTEMEADHYFLTEEIPAGYGTPVAFCAYALPANSTTVVYEDVAVTSEGRIEFDLADTETITCSWFNIVTSATGATSTTTAVGTPGTTLSGSPVAPTATPTPGSDATTLILRVFDCETGYDRRSDDADPAADCPDRPEDVSFALMTLNGQDDDPVIGASTDDEPGVVTFEAMNPEAYRLTEVAFAAGDTAFILSCESDQRSLASYPFSPFALVGTDGSVDLSLVAGETLACDWYHVPALGADVSIQVYECGAAEPSVQTCEPATESAGFVLIPIGDEGEVITFETDASGTFSLEGVRGTFALTEVGEQPCMVSSTAFDDDGNLVLSASGEIAVDVFHCA